MPLKMKIFSKVKNNKTIIKAKYYQNSTHSTVQREKHLKYNEEKGNIVFANSTQKKGINRYVDQGVTRI
jgi:hypothetical protein